MEIPTFFEQNYLFHKKNRFVYNSTSSNQQISSLLKYAEHHYISTCYTRLINLFMKYIHNRYFFNVLNILTSSKSDMEVYYKIYSLIKQSNKSIYKKNLFPYIKSLVQRKITSYLDVGCGNGKKTYYIGREFELPNESIHGIDIQQFYTMNHERKFPIQYKIIEKKMTLPYENHTFDFITTLMVLHHIEEPVFLIKEVKRLLAKNGIFFLKEHDAYDTIDYTLIDIEHAIYEIGMRKNRSFMEKYRGYYKDKYEWIKLIEKEGLKCIQSGIFCDSVKEEISPTRYFYAIFINV